MTTTTSRLRHRPPPEGTVIDGKWVVEAILGHGGMGVVMSARHQALGQQVAIKFLGDAVDAVSRERFFREAKIIASLRSEHVVRVIDVGHTQLSGEALHYIVMERLEGETLSALLKRRGALPPKEAAELVYQACLAMSEAHALGVVHRDLKPGNMFVTTRENGTPWLRVLDFGVSKLAGQEDNELTTTSTLIGSPAYMAPEQVKSSKYVDGRADLWALGVTLQRLITGALPFTGDTPMAICASILSEEPATLDPSMGPAPLLGVVRRALQKSPAARFASAREMADALAPFTDRGARNGAAAGGVPSNPSSSRTLVSAQAAPPEGPEVPRAEVSAAARTLPAPNEGTLAESVAPISAPQGRSRMRAVVASVVGAVAVLGIGGALLFARRGGTDGAREPTAGASATNGGGSKAPTPAAPSTATPGATTTTSSSVDGQPLTSAQLSPTTVGAPTFSATKSPPHDVKLAPPKPTAPKNAGTKPTSAQPPAPTPSLGTLLDSNL